MIQLRVFHLLQTNFTMPGKIIIHAIITMVVRGLFVMFITLQLQLWGNTGYRGKIKCPHHHLLRKFV